MGNSYEDFKSSSMAKITYLINVWADEQQMKSHAMQGEEYESKYFKQSNIETVQSLHEIEGLF